MVAVVVADTTGTLPDIEIPTAPTPAAMVSERTRVWSVASTTTPFAVRIAGVAVRASRISRAAASRVADALSGATSPPDAALICPSGFGATIRSLTLFGAKETAKPSI